MHRKILRVICLSAIVSFFFTGCATTGKYKPVSTLTTLEISFADPIWDGKSVPEGQQCSRFKGNGATPRLTVKNLPPGTNAIIMEYSDRSYAPMDNGGHGKIGYRIPKGTTEITVPSVPGHTFDLPEGFFLVAAHANPSWDKAGAYMPPCSGGRGNYYYVTVKAVYDALSKGEESKLLGKGKIGLGRY